jgi:transcriptional regulator with XRE-family HTH domain
MNMQSAMLRGRRESLGLSVYDLCYRAQVRECSYRKWESGSSNPNRAYFSDVLRVLRVLCIDPVEFAKAGSTG